MTQRCNVPAIHTATFPATLTELLSHSSQTYSGISNTSDLRPQTSDRLSYYNIPTRRPLSTYTKKEYVYRVGTPPIYNKNSLFFLYLYEVYL